MKGPEREELRMFDGVKATWGERRTMIQRQFPSVVNLDWEAVFRADPNILGQLINDILKVDSAVPGKPGKRPALEVKGAENRLRRIVGDDYTSLPFADAVYAVLGNRSILWLAGRALIHKSQLYRVMTGKMEPTVDVIEQVADALDKDPSYFAEYRHLYILGIISKKLESMPDATVVFYMKLKKQNAGSI